MPNFIRSKGPFNNVLNNEMCSDIKTLKKLKDINQIIICIFQMVLRSIIDDFEDTLFCFYLADKIINSFKNL